MTNLDSIFKSRDITLPTKVRLVKAIFFPVVVYGCESWTVKKAECRRIDAFELWCWRRLLRIPWIARRSNQFILKEISPGCSLEGLMLKLKLQYFGHLMQRADSFEKTLILGKIEGRRKRGRQRVRWLDSITDSKDMNLGELSCIGEGNGNPLQCSCLEIPREGGAWWAAVYGIAQSRHDWNNLAAATGSWWWTGRPAVLRFMMSQRVGHYWGTELNWHTFMVTFTRKSLTVIAEMVYLVAQTVQNLPAILETRVWSLGWEDPLGRAA